MKTDYEKIWDSHDKFVLHLCGLDDGFYILTFQCDGIKRLVYLKETKHLFNANRYYKAFHFMDYAEFLLPSGYIFIGDIPDDTEIIPVSIVKSKTTMSVRDLQSIS